jgi:radical SAM superfamily enzyme YgiQ (UPF0313 family)
MKVLLISANTERINMVTIPLGLGLVAAATRRAGHEVSFLDLLGMEDIPATVAATIEKTEPEVIGISIRNIDDQNYLAPRFLLEKARETIETCRAHSSARIVLGGAGFSIFPHAVLRYLGADYGIRGDGETAFPALLERLSGGLDPRGVEGIHVAGEIIDGGRAVAQDLDGLPLWDEALASYARFGAQEIWVPVQSRRGCPNACSYCSTSRVQGSAFRCRSAQRVVEAIGTLAHRGFQRFYFVDNSFNLPEAQARTLCEGLRTIQPGIAWRCILYPHHVGEELVRAMAESGCVEVSVGFESGSETILEGMNKRFKPEDVRECMQLLESYGIRRMGFLLLGGPGETRDTVEQSLALARSLPLDGLKVTVGIRIYPNTPLADRALQDGIVSSGDDLLYPCFYLAPGLEPWIHEVTAGVAF